MDIPVLYIPSFYGDIRLERIDDKETRVIVAKATPAETTALRDVAAHAMKKRWLEEMPPDSAFREGAFVVKAPIKEFQRRLAKALKPGREVVSVVRFENGQMEEIVDVPMVKAAVGGAKTSAAVPVPTAAAAVSKPYCGCPAPAFVKAELRANRVLMAFLNEEQKRDFLRYNRFITVGAATGHSYMVTSRYANDSLADFQRSFFDLDDGVPLCVHDWEVPAAEEMLALHLLASLPQHELYLRRLETDVA